MINYLRFLLIMIYSSPILAMYCPNNFQQINIGDTIQEVQKKCGIPNRTIDVPPPDTGAEAWFYAYKPNPNLKMKIIFIDEALSKITVRNTEFSALLPNCIPTQVPTNPAQSVPYLQSGDSMDDVKAICGEPITVIKGVSPDGDNKAPPKIVRYQYNTTNPPTVLNFQDDKFTGKM